MKRRIIILGTVILLVVAAWTAGWFYVTSLVRQNIVALASADGGTSPRVTCDRLDTGGYPFWIDVTCTNLTVTSGDISATLPTLRGSLLVYNPFEVILFGTSPLTVSDAFSGSRDELDWKNLEASARLTGWRIARISVVGDALTLNDAVGSPIALGSAAHAEPGRIRPTHRAHLDQPPTSLIPSEVEGCSATPLDFTRDERRVRS